MYEVLDLTYHEDEGQGCFLGSYDQCCDFISEQCQGGFGFSTYQIVPVITKDQFWTKVTEAQIINDHAKNC